MIKTLLRSIALGQVFVNYDENKVSAYELPDPLEMKNGRKVTSVDQWEKIQRPFILEQFKQHMYGQFPGKPNHMHFKEYAVDSLALDGKAIRKQVTIFFSDDAHGPSIDVLLYLPKGVEDKVPVFLGLNFYGNHSVSKDPGITLPNGWIPNNKEMGITNNQATEASRGMKESRWPINEIIAQGYGLATAYYGDMEPDYQEGWETGIRSQLKEELGINEQEWGAIGAWAWGLSRIMDYLEKDAAVNAKQVALIGHSRLGKAALWAAANDTRFAMVISNNSGEGGAALARREYGETIERINTTFPHWFSPTFKNYNGRANQLPVDQHMLLALMAPRPLYIASAEEDRWADPTGEFLSAKHAGTVYKIYKKKGLGITKMPRVNKPVGGYIRYHIRTGKHDITLYDWDQYLNFADRHFNKPKAK